MAGCHECGDETAGAMEGGKLLKQLNVYQLVKNAVSYSRLVTFVCISFNYAVVDGTVKRTFGNLLTLSSFKSTGTMVVVLFQVIDHVYNRDAQTYSSILEQQLMPGGQYELHMQFVGRINDHMQGFYRSSYFDPETRQKRYGCKCREDQT